eukprot:gene12203-biopygen1891
MFSWRPYVWTSSLATQRRPEGSPPDSAAYPILHITVSVKFSVRCRISAFDATVTAPVQCLYPPHLRVVSRWKFVEEHHASAPTHRTVQKWIPEWSPLRWQKAAKPLEIMALQYSGIPKADPFWGSFLAPVRPELIKFEYSSDLEFATVRYGNLLWAADDTERDRPQQLEDAVVL